MICPSILYLSSDDHNDHEDHDHEDHEDDHDEAKMDEAKEETGSSSGAVISTTLTGTTALLGVFVMA